ncbi:MAG TPA: signal peptidase II [Caldimonas sp.]|nr:signal peptidase II [Caldimonas sp.]
MAASRPTQRLAPWLAIAAAVVVLDQVAKGIVRASLPLHDGRTLAPFLNIVHVHNTGAAFSFLAGAAGWQRWFFIALGLAAAVFIVWLLTRHGAQRLFALALALILGGAIGNVVDRVLHGYVVDFVQVHWRGWYFPSFNVADSAITVGAALLILDELRRVRRR